MLQLLSKAHMSEPAPVVAPEDKPRRRRKKGIKRARGMEEEDDSHVADIIPDDHLVTYTTRLVDSVLPNDRAAAALYRITPRSSLAVTSDGMLPAGTAAAGPSAALLAATAASVVRRAAPSCLPQRLRSTAFATSRCLPWRAGEEAMVMAVAVAVAVSSTMTWTTSSSTWTSWRSRGSLAWPVARRGARHPRGLFPRRCLWRAVAPPWLSPEWWATLWRCRMLLALQWRPRPLVGPQGRLVVACRRHRRRRRQPPRVVMAHRRQV